MKSSLLPIKVDKGDGPIIVLLHGLGNNHESWTHVLKRFNYSKYRIIALDLVGFGDAPKPTDGSYTPDYHAHAVVKTLESIGVKNATIAGHSMGCIVAVEIANKYPEMVKSLVLLGAPIYSSAEKTKGVYFNIFSFLKDNPEITITSSEAADKLIPMLKGMEITEETWPAFKKSLEKTIMQYKTFKDLKTLKLKTILVCGIFDFFVIRKNLKNVSRINRKFLRLKTVLGPHEITPIQGRTVAKIIQKGAIL